MRLSHSSRCSLALLVLVFAGCASKPTLMPTPNVYAWGNFDPFENVPPALQNNRVDVIYYTDRAPEKDDNGALIYGYKRSRSASFGTSQLVIGNNVSWQALTQASRTKTRNEALELSIVNTKELGRFEATPRGLIQLVDSAATQPAGGALGAQMNLQHPTEEAFRQNLSNQLANSPVKEVFIFVHGFNNTFNDAVQTIGQLWHFFGRRGVPIAYTWPAGSPGALSYMYDRESSEFTVYHLKHMLRLVASCPDVEKINIISHSRGTDVATAALRELHIHYRAAGQNTRQALKLGSVVLAAPDLDFDVVMQRLATEKLGQVPESTTIYVCSEDKALGVSNWLFSGLKRLGQLRSEMFPPEELAQMRQTKVAQFIDARISDAGAFGHDYFHSNPAVSSDLILMMRYKLPPGAENARPLRITQNGFWAVDDNYPGPARDLTKETKGK